MLRFEVDPLVFQAAVIGPRVDVERGQAFVDVLLPRLAPFCNSSVRFQSRAARARTDTRARAVTRRERTRHLIELGGLVAKAGLIELAIGDRVVLLSAFLAAADRPAGEDRERLIELWGRRGRRALGLESEAVEGG